MKKIKNWIVYHFNSLWNSYHFWYMKRKAENLHKLTGKQYFIVPASKYKLAVVNNDYVGWYNKMASKTPGVKKITHPDLLKMCYYKTACGNYTR